MEEGEAEPKVTVSAEALAELRALAGGRFCVAMGECGLDYDRMFSPRPIQLAVFEAQVALAAELGLPLFVHLRERDADKGEAIGAYTDALAILWRHAAAVPPHRVCVHCFTGGLDDLQPLASAGFYVGVTGFVGIAKRSGETIAALRALSSGGEDDAAPVLSAERILLETDAPFMAPDKQWLPRETGLGGRKNEPAAMAAVCRAVAAALGVAPSVLARQTSENSDRFFGLPARRARLASGEAQ